MDPYRMIMVCLIQTLFNISNMSPNTETSDNEKNSNGKYFLTNIFHLVFVNVLTCVHLILFGDRSLIFMDYIWFVGVLCGFILRMYAYYTLGYFFTFMITIRKDHKLIKTGPYKYLVHPA